MPGRGLHTDGVGSDQLQRGQKGGGLNEMKLHILPAAPGSTLGLSEPLLFCSFDCFFFFSRYNKPENDVLAPKPSGGLVAQGNVTVKLRMVISTDMGYVIRIQKLLSVYE